MPLAGPQRPSRHTSPASQSALDSHDLPGGGSPPPQSQPLETRKSETRSARGIGVIISGRTGDLKTPKTAWKWRVLACALQPAERLAQHGTTEVLPMLRFAWLSITLIVLSALALACARKGPVTFIHDECGTDETEPVLAEGVVAVRMVIGGDGRA